MRSLQLGFISDKSTVRLLKVLNYIEHKNTFTLRALAETIAVSERTIASDVKYLKDHFGDAASFISGSKGYIFKEVHLTEYKERKKQLFANECLFEIIERIFYGMRDRIDELAHYYNYSETSFRRLLTKSNYVLKSYGLSWSSSPLGINGTEGNLRKFFKDFFYEGIDTPYTVKPDNRLHELFIREFGNKIGKYEIGSGTTPESFYYTVYVAVKRVEQGKKISIPKELQKLVYEEQDFLTFYPISEIIERLYHVKMPKEELAWIYLVTICKRSADLEKLEKGFFERFNLWPEIPKITSLFLKERAIPEEARPKMALYLNSFFLSRKINDVIAPALNKELLEEVDQVIEEKLTIYTKNSKFYDKCQMNQFLNPKYLDEICLSFTLYSEIIIELYVPSKTIYFMLEGNHFICQAIRIKAIKLFGKQHRLLFVPLHYLTKENLNRNNIDLIVTNYDRYISDFIEDRSYLLIKEVPEQQDWVNIAKKVNPYQLAIF